MRNGRWLTTGIAVSAALPFLYVAAYLALLEPGSPIGIGTLTHPIMVRMTSYRVGGEFAEWLFAPLHAIDRTLRPTFWREEYDSPSIG